MPTTRDAGAIWLLLAAVLAIHVVILEMGPQPDTVSGLATQVVSQKLVLVASVLCLAYQSYRVGRMT